jgi:transposase
MRIGFVLIHVTNQGGLSWPFRLGLILIRLRLRAWAKKAKDGPQARRLLALAAIYDGATRAEAARIDDVTLQIVRDWALKFNAHGPDGLLNRKSPGQPPRLNDAQRAAICGHDRERADPGDPWRCSLARRRSFANGCSKSGASPWPSKP